MDHNELYLVQPQPHISPKKKRIIIAVIIISQISISLAGYFCFGLGISISTTFISQGLAICFSPRRIFPAQILLTISVVLFAPIFFGILCLIILNITIGPTVPSIYNFLDFDTPQHIRFALVMYSIAATSNLFYLIAISIRLRRLYDEAEILDNLEFDPHFRYSQLNPLFINNNNSNSNINNNGNPQSIIAPQNAFQNNPFFSHIVLIDAEGNEIDVSHLEQFQHIRERVNMMLRDLENNQFMSRFDQHSSIDSRDALSQEHGEDCAICYEPFDKNDKSPAKKLIALKCAHKFHAVCLRYSIQAIGKKCPYCKTSIWEHIKPPGHSQQQEDNQPEQVPQLMELESQIHDEIRIQI